MRILVRGHVPHRVQPQHGDVGEVSLAQVPPFGPLQEVGCEPGHRTHRVRQGDEALVEHEFADLLRERPEGAGVGDRPGGSRVAPVGAGHHPVELRQVAHVLDVVEAEVHHRGVPLAQDVAGRGGRLHAQFVGHLPERPAVQFGPPVGEQKAIGPAPDGEHFECLTVDHLDRVGVVEAPQHRRVAPRHKPARDRIRAQVGLGRGVGVMRAGDLDPARPRRLDQRRSLRGPAVVVGPLGVEMAENDLGPRLFADADALLDRLQVAEGRIRGAEITVVGVVDRPRVLGGDPVQLDHLLGLRVVAGQVEEPGGEAVCAFLHALAHQGAHLVQLGLGGRAVRHPQHLAPHPVVAHGEEGVHADAVRGPLGQPVRHMGRAAPVEPERDGRDALEEERARIPPVIGAEFGVRVHVDEAGGDHQPARVDRVQRRDPRARGIPHEADAVARHRHVGRRRLAPRTVQHRAAEDEGVGRVPARSAGGERERKKGHAPERADPGDGPHGLQGRTGPDGAHHHRHLLQSGSPVSPVSRPGRRLCSAIRAICEADDRDLDRAVRLIYERPID